MHSACSSYPTGCPATATTAADEEAIGVPRGSDKGEAVSAGEAMVPHDPRSTAANKHTAVLFMFAFFRRTYPSPTKPSYGVT